MEVDEQLYLLLIWKGVPSEVIKRKEKRIPIFCIIFLLGAALAMLYEYLV